MDALRNGLILFTERYEACVELYARTLALSIWFSKPELTCFRFGQSYLMIEHGGVAAAGEKSPAQSPVVLRVNVPNIEAACATLRERGVKDANVTHYALGEHRAFSRPRRKQCSALRVAQTRCHSAILSTEA